MPVSRLRLGASNGSRKRGLAQRGAACFQGQRHQLYTGVPMPTQDNQDRSQLAPILSGWKDIAGYVRKGIRTVQRWEREYDFPVRRTHVGPKSTVLAVPIEIDSWVRARDFQKSAHGKTERMLLLQSLKELRAEVQQLRRLLEAERSKR
jgi:hypothetical protein